MQQMQLVRLDTILSIDSSVAEVADIKLGFSAKRETKDSPWKLVIDSK
ncbi:MAG: hypothetical protein K9M11_03560 [Candidatus Pacebacteria bacterium]|nr:hypothetical protein [Candidatus Paceibacterota bacterium]